jgi:2-succinyl-5-enolpyruvyl-6-hydroxy-3-cyclohexene-1-carboxylate synthase
VTASNPSQLFAETLVDELVRCGVKDACLAPGSRSGPVATALSGNDNVRLHVVIDERSAGFLAVGLARATRRPVVVACTSGTAAANLHPAVVEAHNDRVPLLVLTADRPPELRHAGANQTIDQIKLYGDAVRWFCEVGAPDADSGLDAYWRSTACRAVASATSSPPGPVHLNLALREPLTSAPGAPPKIGGRPDGRPWTETTRPAITAPREELERLAAEIGETERGLIVAGACDIDTAPVLELAHVAGWPVLAEPGSNLRSGGEAVSCYEALLRAGDFSCANTPDMVLRIGKIGISRALLTYLAPQVKQVLVDRDGAWLDPRRSLSRIVRSDPSRLCAELVQNVPPRRGSAWLHRWMEAEAAARDAIDAVLDAGDSPSEPRTARDLARVLPDGSTLVVAASMPVRDLDSFMEPRTGVRVVGNRGANGIDGFVSTALGVALGSQGPTAALCGDLSLLHDQNGLLLARRDPVDCVFVVVNNDGGGIFSFLPHADSGESFERLFATPHDVDIAALAGLYGCGYGLVEAAADLDPLVTKALASGGTHIVEVRTERDANVALHRRIWAEVAAAL